METGKVVVRHAVEADFDGWCDLYEAVAAEGKWIGRELPVDREEQRRRFLDSYVNPAGAVALMADVDGRQVGHMGVTTHLGVGEIGMVVDAAWRGLGMGSALMAAAVEWAAGQGLHKLALQLWPHNVAARALYQKFGFVEEGRLRRHYRRHNGELWDAVVMGLVLDTTSAGSSL